MATELDNTEYCAGCGCEFEITDDTFVTWSGSWHSQSPPEPSYHCSACTAKIEAAWARAEARAEDEYMDR